MRLIKRYSNRRLYDTETSQTLTQAELAGLVKNGVEIQVVDTATGEDITLAVLGRVLMNEASSWDDAVKSKELFSRIISLGGEKSMSILKNTVLASIGAIQVTREKAEKIIDDLIKKGDLDKSDRKKAVMELLEKAEKSSAKWREKVSKEAGRIQKEVVTTVKKLNVANKDDLKKLDAKVTRLAKAVKALEKKIDELHK
ncbi:MAG TPA: polyhydroxyalkanoate synthesis regulator DNA-binding domain-containing protein [candidate division Zixibacteria bacterium]|nr:polyhydroxyalkanoate synthesis regulator DNA-binding domain-containing protein [candidate division Zixibacteria bacterium]